MRITNVTLQISLPPNVQRVSRPFQSMWPVSVVKFKQNCYFCKFSVYYDGESGRTGSKHDFPGGLSIAHCISSSLCCCRSTHLYPMVPQETPQTSMRCRCRTADIACRRVKRVQCAQDPVEGTAHPEADRSVPPDHSLNSERRSLFFHISRA